jgi:RNA polymerase sigma-70 factor (ECF subfamily)
MPTTEVMVQTFIEMRERQDSEHPEKFWQILDRFRADLVHQAYVILGNKEDAEDAAQEALSAAFLNLDKLRDSSKLGQWLRGINRNVALKLRRQRDASKEERLATGQMGALEAPRNTTGSKMPVGDVAFVHRAIDALPEQFREVLVLRYWEKLSVEEISARLEIPLGTAASRLVRGELMLAKKLKCLIQQERHPKCAY